MRVAGPSALLPPLLQPPPLPPPCRQVCEEEAERCRRRYGEKVKQSQGEEAEAVGGASSHGCRLCQSGRCQQGDAKLNSPGPFHQSLPRTCDFRARQMLGDPLEAFPVFKKYDRNGLNVSIECKRVSGLEPATVDWAFDLTKTNMQTMYEQSEWGWKDREKREEMTDDRACYEVQLESKVRRKGLGKFLIQILQLMANSTQMKKVMLTVFKHNHGAYQFFREALQFEIDDSSPSMSGCCGEDCSYEILSRRTKFGDSHHSHAGGHCGGCCH
eukprot:XP_011543557.1 N-alpha-acetyltransferase 40 isoform X2 [Homo sapiens]